MTQEQLNNNIAEELNKWQTILEYGRIYLDEEKALRNKYKWLTYLKNSLPWAVILTLIEGLLSIYQGEMLWFIILGLLVTVIIIFIIVIICHRGIISKFIDIKERRELEGLLEVTNIYLSKLGRWLSELDSRCKVPTSKVFTIEIDFIEARAIQLSNENIFSSIHGILNEEWDARAKDYAEKRLQPLKQYIYE